MAYSGQFGFVIQTKFGSKLVFGLLSAHRKWSNLGINFVNSWNGHCCFSIFFSFDYISKNSQAGEKEVEKKLWSEL